MSFKAIIVDDEPKGRTNLRKMLEEYSAEVDVLAEAGTIEEAVALVKEKQPDILFLDIELQDGSGFDVLAKFPTRTFDVIFVTAYNEYALKALKEQAIDYLLKPIDPEELVKAIVKISAKKQQIGSPLLLDELRLKAVSASPVLAKLQVPFDRGIRFVDVDKITRIKAKNNYSEIYLDGGEKIICSLTLGRLEEQLQGGRFIRVHQSHLVNIKFISKYYRTAGGQLEMVDGSSIEISRRKKDELLKILRSNG